MFRYGIYCLLLSCVLDVDSINGRVDCCGNRTIVHIRSNQDLSSENIQSAKEAQTIVFEGVEVNDGFTEFLCSTINGWDKNIKFINCRASVGYWFSDLLVGWDFHGVEIIDCDASWNDIERIMRTITVKNLDLSGNNLNRSFDDVARFLRKEMYGVRGLDLLDLRRNGFNKDEIETLLRERKAHPFGNSVKKLILE